MADNPDNSKDLDFDELHEAVNALMNQAQKGKAPKSQSAKVDEPKPEPKPAEPKTDSKPERAGDTGHSIAVNVKRTLPDLSSKQHKGSHGRAMDVVARQKPESITPPSAKVKRQAPALQPTGPIQPEEPAPTVVPDKQTPLPPQADSGEGSDDLNEALASLNAQEPADEVGPTLTHQKSDFPDPLDAFEQQEQQPGADQSQPDQEAGENRADVEQSSTDSVEDDKSTEMPDTPFVTTKVEKRPLGAYSNVAQDEESVEQEQVPSGDGADEQSQDQSDTPSPLPPQPRPEEFNPAVVAVESIEPETAPADSDAPQDEDQTDLRAMSIPQQYKDAVPAESDSPRPVFDTKEYHPAIEARTGHSHHSALSAWAMALLLLVLLVVVLGAVYYFVTGTLDPTILL